MNTRKQTSDIVLEHIRENGPQTGEEIQAALGLTKRAVDDALYLLMSHARIEYTHPVRSPLAYQVSTEIRP